MGLRPSYECVALWCAGGRVVNRGLPDVQRFPWSGHKPSGHPAEKPQALVEWCLDAVEAQSALDPFMGSGTTGAACARTGRRFVGIETNRRWFDMAIARIEGAFDGVKPAQRAAGQLPLFARQPEDTAA